MSVQKPSGGEVLQVLSDSKRTVKDRAAALSVILNSQNNDLISILPKHISLDRVKQQFILSVKSNPKLLDCDPASLIKSLFTSCSMGLEPDPYFGQVYLIPYGKEVQVIPGYKGLMKLVRNTGEIASICCEAVHENDSFEYQLGSDPFVKHKPALNNRGNIVAFYCVSKFKDGSVSLEWMNREEIDRIKAMSAAVKGGRSTPWNEHYEEMGKKTVFRRAVKRLPISLSRELATAIQSDDAAHNGRVYQVDPETGEVLDVWAEPVNDEASALNPLDKFAVEEKTA